MKMIHHDVCQTLMIGVKLPIICRNKCFLYEAFFSYKKTYFVLFPHFLPNIAARQSRINIRKIVLLLSKRKKIILFINFFLSKVKDFFPAWRKIAYVTWYKKKRILFLFLHNNHLM